MRFWRLLCSVEKISFKRIEMSNVDVEREENMPHSDRPGRNSYESTMPKKTYHSRIIVAYTFPSRTMGTRKIGLSLKGLWTL